MEREENQSAFGKAEKTDEYKQQTSQMYPGR
jgi:hypothetical protein